MDAPVDSVQDKWQLLPAFLRLRGLFMQHIDSFNFFVDHEINEIVKASSRVDSDIDPHFYMDFSNARVRMPERADTDAHDKSITPHECRMRDLTYAADICVDVEYLRGHQRVRQRGVVIGKLPIMLRSNKCVLYGKNEHEMARLQECPLDPGGYFVVRGTEKVILIQEQLSKNRIIVAVDSTKDEVTAKVSSVTHERKSNTEVLFGKPKPTKRLFLKHNSFTELIPLVIALKAMGMTIDKEIAQMIAGDDKQLIEILAPSIEEAQQLKVFTQNQALEWIGARRKVTRKSVSSRRSLSDDVLETLQMVILAHVPTIGLNFRPKCIYLALMARRALQTSLNPGQEDDLDFLGNKRLELAGHLLALMFEDLFKRYQAELKLNIDKVLKKPDRKQEFDAGRYLHMHGDLISQGLARAISSGNWNIKRFRMERAGVTHLLCRFSYIAALGMLTRVASQVEKSRKSSGPRALQTSQWGMLCPSDTPEGEQCGLVRNMALMSHITTDVDPVPIVRILYSLGVEDFSLLSGVELHGESAYIVMMNGQLLGVTRNAKQLLRSYRRLRRAGRIAPFASIAISRQYRTVNISSDGGRICRPLIIVDENGHSVVKQHHIDLLVQGKYTFDDFLRLGLVEYVDVNEENDALIAIYEKDLAEARSASPRVLKYTHLEIEPFAILGAVAGVIPFPDHNQSPRNTYQCAMGKQAMGAIGYNQQQRIDTIIYLLTYPQQPMVKSKTIELIGYDKLPAGQNAILTVMSFSGYDIEDALILNRGSLDRGFGRCHYLRKYQTMIKSYANGTYDRIVDAPRGPDGKVMEMFDSLESDGLAGSGLVIKTGQVIVNRQTPASTTNEIGAGGMMRAQPETTYKPAPMKYKAPVNGVVDKMMITQTEGNQTLIKVLMRQTRRPELGDKFSSRHGQKGVCGLIVPQEDMPFTDDGIVPDVVMNPHGFPKRMTIGKMLELLSGKAGVLTGELQYGTAFGGSDPEEMCRILVQNGYSYSGKDYMTSGITGEPVESYVFRGPVFYQKLKHMVLDKMHSRSTGPVNATTRQPMEGRSKDGGLRLGEMERDCLIGYGASSLIIERLMISSDASDMFVCEQCGLIAYQGWCRRCRSGKGVVSIRIPYAAKLLFQELTSMNITPKLILEDA
ncbi:DNA-directed RNA polymerase III 130 kDa polypeptide [Ramicandelaber brevisporus]|nr:DNA-directed RNA polymerase III 130 kDa polypeptide [Ramicandelaber brevisporus]